MRQAIKEGGVLFHDDDTGNGFNIAVSGVTVDQLLAETRGVGSLVITPEK